MDLVISLYAIKNARERDRRTFLRDMLFDIFYKAQMPRYVYQGGGADGPTNISFFFFLG